MRIFGLVSGLVGGGMFGLIQSTKFMLKTLDELGPEYALGRQIQQEVEDYRLDKKKSV